MSLRSICALLCMVAVSVKGVTIDFTDPNYFTFRATRPEADSPMKNLNILGIFEGKDDIESVDQIMIYAGEPGNERISSSDLLTIANPTSKKKFMGKSKFEVTSVLNNERSNASVVNLIWNEESYGYCRRYRCIVDLTDKYGEKHSLNKTLTVGAYPGEECSLEEKLVGETGTSENQEEQSGHTKIPEYIQDAFPDVTQEQQEEILNKINSIDNDTYDVSSIYQGRLYIATMQDTNFELHKMNELCKSSGGYLVELDSPEEQNFVRDFLKSIGSYRYFIGANDVDSEGNFVYYNSKKPVTNVVWKEGEPNNGGGNESCVEILKKGLNDKTCTKPRGYICEIPLVEEAPPGT